ncbi:hypothetical protein GCM10020000_47500 [Streptomyces olivoverticillatus]
MYTGKSLLMPRTHAMPLRRTALAAGALLAALSLTACDGSTGSGSGGGSNSSSAKADQPLKLGQPSPETQEVQRYNKTGKFTITPQKVVMGKPADLDELKDQKYKGYTLAWAYVKAKLVGGDTPLRGPMIATNVGMQMEGGQQGTRLIVLMGGLSSRLGRLPQRGHRSRLAEGRRAHAVRALRGAGGQEGRLRPVLQGVQRGAAQVGG